MSPAPQHSAPDTSQPILGWRVWHLNRDGLLQPIAVAGHAWMPGTNEARCHMYGSRHRAPGLNCVCGFNALHTLPEEFRGDTGHAIGAIAAWGAVDVYRTGFRAQYACVLGLLADAPAGCLHDEKLRAAADHYGVPMLPLPELRAHVSEYAQPAGEMLLPGVSRGAPRQRRPTQPLPLAALAHAFEGRGVQVNTHLAVDHRRRFMRLGPTPSLAALTGDRIEPTVQPGDVISEGDPLFLASVGASVVLVPAPAAGAVRAVNDGAPRFEQGPAGEGWAVELRLDSESLDGSSIAWGRRGAEAYREYVLAAGSDADLLLTCAQNPAPAAALLEAEESRAWLRAFAQRLDTCLRGDEALCAALSSLGGAVSFEVAGVEAMRVGPPPLGSSRWVSTAAPGGSQTGGPLTDGLAAGAGNGERDPGVGPELRIELRPEDLRSYWRGELGLAPDHVSVAGTDLGADRSGPRNPLHLRSGQRGDLLLANSLHKRLFVAAREILDELGNPWFKAGDAIADPVRNLEVLAGFERPDSAGTA